MKRQFHRVLTPFLLALAYAAGTRPAAAQATPNAASTPTSPPESSAAPSEAGIAPGFVRVHVRTYRGKSTARVYSSGAAGAWQFLCQSPCVTDVRAGSELRVTLGSNEDEPHTVIVSGDLGPEMDLEVRPPSVAPLIGGIVMMAGGGAFVLSGLLFVALADVSDNVNRGYSSFGESGMKSTGYIFIGLGAAAAVGGLIWLTTRSHEPRTLDMPHRGANTYGRTETLAGDMASAKPRDPTTLVPAPFVPLQLDFRF